MITAKIAVEQALTNDYPISLETLLQEKFGNLTAENFQQLINWLNLNLNIVDSNIFKIEQEMKKNGDYKPI